LRWKYAAKKSLIDVIGKQEQGEPLGLVERNGGKKSKKKRELLQ